MSSVRARSLSGGASGWMANGEGQKRKLSAGLEGVDWGRALLLRRRAATFAPRRGLSAKGRLARLGPWPLWLCRSTSSPATRWIAASLAALTHRCCLGHRLCLGAVLGVQLPLGALSGCGFGSHGAGHGRLRVARVIDASWARRSGACKKLLTRLSAPMEYSACGGV